ncbi:MAG TPA: hypothetical protein DCZ95_13020 [Verrucomicrobia bacterium]|nr:MAG: hypothetical protein A2X46_11640 [Lentisphaerae bacterium GWF2_57_35]HBA85009.1 hypothetical protein [Verrucomicrobiota bacterium]
MANARESEGSSKRPPVRLWLPWIVFGLMLVSLGLAAWLYFVRQKAVFIRQTRDELEAMAELKADQIVRWRKARLADAESIKANPLVRDWVTKRMARTDAGAVDATTLEWLSSLTVNAQYRNAMLLDPAGKILAVVHPEDEGLSVDELPLIGECAKQGVVLFTDIRRSRDADLCCLDLLIPVLPPQDAQPPAAAVILLRVDPRVFLFPLIRWWPSHSRAGESLLVRKENDSVAYLHESRTPSGASQALNLSASDPALPAAMAVRGQTGFVKGSDRRGRRVYAAIRPVPDTSWHLVAQVTIVEANALLRAQARYIATVLAGIVAAALLAWSMWRQRWATGFYERTLNESEERLHQLFEHMSCGVVVYRPAQQGEDFVIDDINRAGEKFSRVARKDVVGRSVLEVFPCIRSMGLFAVLQRVWKSGAPEHQVLTLYQDNRLSEWVENYVYKLPSGEVVALYNDVSDRKRAEDEVTRLHRELERRVSERTAQLETANRELEAFSYTISHDLRAPLRGINGFARILQEEYETTFSEDGRRYLRLIQENACQMGQLIDALLDFSRLGRQLLNRQAVDFSSLVNSIVKDQRAEAGTRQVEWVVGRLPTAQVDPALMKQVFVNLLSNALKFTRKKEKAVIEIGSYRKNGVSVCYVRDNGVGFDMQYKQKLFGVFQRLHRVEEYEGTGVGLAIVQRIVQRHGGLAWAEGKVNEGATFYFTLPDATVSGGVDEMNI